MTTQYSYIIVPIDLMEKHASNNWKSTGSRLDTIAATAFTPGTPPYTESSTTDRDLQRLHALLNDGYRWIRDYSDTQALLELETRPDKQH